MASFWLVFFFFIAGYRGAVAPRCVYTSVLGRLMSYGFMRFASFNRRLDGMLQGIIGTASRTHTQDVEIRVIVVASGQVMGVFGFGLHSDNASLALHGRHETRNGIPCICFVKTGDLCTSFLGLVV